MVWRAKPPLRTVMIGEPEPGFYTGRVGPLRRIVEWLTQNEPGVFVVTGLAAGTDLSGRGLGWRSVAVVARA
jgi:hypothetical protein